MREIFDMEQGTDEWHQVRCGIPTASSFKHLLAKGQKGEASKTRRKYLTQLAGEVLTGRPALSHSNQHTERGHEQEPEARELYQFMTDRQVEQIGFIRNGRKGASPDGMIGDNGGVEIKTREPHLQVEALLRTSPLPEHKAQVQGQLWVAEWDWIDLVSYCPGMPLAIWRAHRDEPYIAKMAEAHTSFMDDLDEIIDQIRSQYGWDV